MASDALSVAHAVIETFNAGERERHRATFTDDTVSREHATATTRQGIDETVNANFAWRDAFPDVHGEITASLADGDRVALQIVWRGTHEGDLRGPGGMVIPPSGRQATVPACMLLEIRDGLVAESDHYFDLLTLLAQIGAAPSG